MSLYATKRLIVAGSLDNVPCPVSIDLVEQVTVRIRPLNCGCSEESLCLPQAAARTFNFTAPDSVNLSGVSSVTFDVWPGRKSGAALISYELGSEITLPSDNVISLKIPSSDSQTFPAGSNYYELWVTTAGGDPIPVARGTFLVADTRKYD